MDRIFETIFVLLFLILLSFIFGCCSNYSQKEKILLGSMIAANAADAWSTTEYVSKELNPILGERPDDGNVWLFKSGVVGTFFLLGEIFPEKREGIYTIGIMVGGMLAIWNVANGEF